MDPPPTGATEVGDDPLASLLHGCELSRPVPSSADLKIPVWSMGLLFLGASAVTASGATRPQSTTVGAAITTTQAPAAVSRSNVTGRVLDGAVPICDATVMLYEAGTTGYGAGATVCGSASSDSKGRFSIVPACQPPATAEMYLIANGGSLNPKRRACNGAGLSSISMASVLGRFSGATARSWVVNALTTVASVEAMAQFLNRDDPTLIGTPSTDLVGIQNAAATVANLVRSDSGHLSALWPAPHSCRTNSLPGCAGEMRLITIADALSACIEGGDYSALCGELFESATSPGNLVPINTLQAAAGIALNPVKVHSAGIVNVAKQTKIYGVPLAVAPTDWMIALNFTGGGMDFPFAVEVDGFGNVWITNSGIQQPFGRTCGSVTKLSPTGRALSPSKGFTGGGILTPQFLAIDSGNNVWVTNSGWPFKGAAPKGCASSSNPAYRHGYAGSVTELDQSGRPIGDGPFLNVFFPMGAAFDSANNLWVANFPYPYNGATFSNVPPLPLTDSGFLTELDASGKWLNFAEGGGLNFPVIPAIDGFGNVWVASCGPGSLSTPPYYCFSEPGNVSEFDSSGTPLSGAGGYAGTDGPGGIAIDSKGRIWTANVHNNSVTVLCGSDSSQCGGLPAGSVLAQNSGPDLDAPNNIIMDGADVGWVSGCGQDCAGATKGTLVGVTASGQRITAPQGFTGSGLKNPSGDAIDASGNVWVSNGYSDSSVNGGLGSVTEIIGVAKPTMVPLAPAGAGAPAPTE